jgi:SAM-dependent methyltransferase
MQQHPRRHTEILREATAFAGRCVLEAGCGAGRLLAWLARQGAAPIGLDPDPAQLARARAEAPGVPLVAGVGEALPFASGSMGLVLYFNSLHHVPMDRQWQALAEAARVLQSGGELLVVEPLPEGGQFALLQPVEDETEVRREAFRALHAAGALGLRMVREVFYDTRVVQPSWEVARAQFLAAAPARADVLRRLEPELRALFERLGELQPDGGRAFSQPMRLNFLRRLP